MPGGGGGGGAVAVVCSAAGGGRAVTNGNASPPRDPPPSTRPPPPPHTVGRRAPPVTRSTSARHHCVYAARAGALNSDRIARRAQRRCAGSRRRGGWLRVGGVGRRVVAAGVVVRPVYESRWPEGRGALWGSAPRHSGRGVSGGEGRMYRRFVLYSVRRRAAVCPDGRCGAAGGAAGGAASDWIAQRTVRSHRHECVARFPVTAVDSIGSAGDLFKVFPCSLLISAFKYSALVRHVSCARVLSPWPAIQCCRPPSHAPFPVGEL